MFCCFPSALFNYLSDIHVYNMSMLCSCMCVCLIQPYIEEKWADILLHFYYPALLSAFSLLILFWAEVHYIMGCAILGLFCCTVVGLHFDHCLFLQIFYQSTTTPSENHVFLKKHKYSLTFFSFNALVYLLLLAEVIATPLVHDDAEQVNL